MDQPNPDYTDFFASELVGVPRVGFCVYGLTQKIFSDSRESYKQNYKLTKSICPFKKFQQIQAVANLALQEMKDAIEYQGRHDVRLMEFRFHLLDGDWSLEKYTEERVLHAVREAFCRSTTPVWMFFLDMHEYWLNRVRRREQEAIPEKFHLTVDRMIYLVQRCFDELTMQWKRESHVGVLVFFGGYPYVRLEHPPVLEGTHEVTPGAMDLSSRIPIIGGAQLLFQGNRFALDVDQPVVRRGAEKAEESGKDSGAQEKGTEGCHGQGGGRRPGGGKRKAMEDRGLVGGGGTHCGADEGQEGQVGA